MLISVMRFNLLFDEITEICAIYEMIQAVININDYKIVAELFLTNVSLHTLTLLNLQYLEFFKFCK